MVFGAEAGQLRVLSEEALILAAVGGACVLLVLGVLELIWPTRRRRRRRARPEPAQPRPIPAPAPIRPAQSILPRRLIDSPSANRPTGGFVFPPPADYVPPPLPRGEVKPIRPLERPTEPSPPEPVGPQVPEPAPAQLEVPSFLIPVAEPEAPPEPHYIPPLIDETPIAEEQREAEPGVELRHSTEPESKPERVEAESKSLEAEIAAFEFRPVQPEPQPVEPEPPPASKPLIAELVEVSPLLDEPALPVTEPTPSRDEPVLSVDVAQPLLVEPPEPRSPVALPEPPPAEVSPPLAEPEAPTSTPREPPAPERQAWARPAWEPPAWEPPASPVTSGAQPVEPEPHPFERVPTAFEPTAPSPEEIDPSQPMEPLPPPPRRRSKISPHARPHRVLRPAPPPPGTPQPPETPQAATSWASSASAEPWGRPSLPTGSAKRDTTLERDSPLVERCFALYQDKRFGEALAVGEQALGRLGSEARATPTRETAALWSVVGLAKQALGDDDGAHAAFESSIDAAPETERATYRRHLASLALDAAQSRLAQARGHDIDDRMSMIRAAIAWTERGLAAVVSDTALTDMRETAHDALWQAYEQAATALLQRQEYPRARQILRDALDDPRIPAARAASFRGLLSGTFGGEIGQLTAQAILSMQDGRESEALGALQRAEALLETIPADSLPPTRRDEVDQRLWWGYAELGSRRLDAGDYEDALDPLVHALRFTSIGAERQGETRAAVVRALEGIAALRALSIRRLAEAGSRDEAIVAAGELQGLLKRGVEMGLSEDELAAALARVRRLCEELGMDARA